MIGKRATASTLLLVVILIAAAGAATLVSAESLTRNQPILFTQNEGQWDNQIHFRAAIDGATMWFAKDRAYYQFVRLLPMDNSYGHVFDEQMPEAECMGISATFVGASNSAMIVGEEMVDYKCNYFLGINQSKWKTGVSNYKSIVYQGIYRDINLRYYGNGPAMEYDFIVSPGGDVSDIQIQYDGVEGITVTEAGELEITTAWGVIIEQAPVVYQPTSSGQVDLVGEYRLVSDNVFGFEVDGEYDPDLPLVIDPVLSYSSYLGGNLGDYGWGIELVDDGSIILCGATYSTDFPVEFPYQATWSGEMDLTITKLSTTEGLIFSTYFGSTNREESPRMDVDDLGNIYIVCRAFSDDLPTVNAFDNDLTGNSDMYVFKMDPTGSSIIFATYLGGTDDDMAAAIHVDHNYNVYVGGITYSQDFPTLNPFQLSPSQGTEDMTLTKFSVAGDALEYSTYLGGTQNEQLKSIVVDDAGFAYVAGYTYSRGFPIVNAYDSTFGGYQDAFLTKFVPEGNDVVFSTFLGGDTYNEWISGIDLDAEGNVYATGATMSWDFPLVNPYQDWFGGGTNVECDAFVCKFSNTGTELLYSTYLGGTEDDYGMDIEVDQYGLAHVIGYTYAVDFPLSDPIYDVLLGQSDAFVSTLSPAGNVLAFSTFLGGSDTEIGRTIAVDELRNVHVTGYTLSPDFPFVNGYQDTRYGTRDAFVSVFEMGCCYGETGNLDYDLGDNLNALDAIYMVNWMYKEGDPPICLEEGDVNGDGQTIINDLIYLVNFLWRSGPSPAPCAP